MPACWRRKRSKRRLGARLSFYPSPCQDDGLNSLAVEQRLAKVTLIAYHVLMGKRVVDLTAEELEEAAFEAWTVAAYQALAKGLSVTGSRDGRLYRYHPDGRVEDLGSVDSLSQASSLTLVKAASSE